MHGIPYIMISRFMPLTVTMNRGWTMLLWTTSTLTDSQNAHGGMSTPNSSCWSASLPSCCPTLIDKVCCFTFSNTTFCWSLHRWSLLSYRLPTCTVLAQGLATNAEEAEVNTNSYQEWASSVSQITSRIQKRTSCTQQETAESELMPTFIRGYYPQAISTVHLESRELGFGYISEMFKRIQ